MGNAGSYILNFASVILGLAVGDMLIDLDRLLRPRVRVRWHPLPLISTAFVMVVLLAAWWELYFIASIRSLTVAEFLPYFFKLILIFLIAAGVLPSDRIEEEVDLKAYYFANSRRLFGLWWLLTVVILFMPTLQGQGWPPPKAYLLDARGLIGMAVLAVIRKPIVHWVVLPVLFVLFTWQWLNVTIGG